MNGLLRPIRRGGLNAAVATVVAVGGFATAALVGAAIARTFTLKVAKNAQVTNQSGSTTSESIVVNSHGFAVYALTGDSPRHPECTRANGCFGFWPPVTVASRKNLSKSAGVRGRLGVWRRDGFLQVTLAGHPLYRYSGDSQRHSATGQGIRTFGGTWHVIKAATAAGGTTTSTGTTSTMTTTTTTTCLYPGYC
jgi:predicted lipoprotein with Yx(FWY)xxD motif